MNPVQFYEYGKSRLVTPNTFIGGVSSSLNTPLAVANKLGIIVSRVTSFSIIGSDIQFAVTGGSYALPSSAFVSNTLITYFIDELGLCTTINNQCFRGCSNIVNLKFPNITALPDFSVEGLSSLQTAYFSSCLNFGLGGNFLGVPQSCVITAPLASLTNGTLGAPNGGLIVANCLVTYLGYVDDSSWNTEIKGVSATENSRLLIGRNLGCSPAALLNFQIVGSNIRFKIYGKYRLRSEAYRNRSDITGFEDNQNLLHILGGGCFWNCANLKYLTLNGLTGNYACNNDFRDTALLELILNNITSISGNYIARDVALGKLIFANLIDINTNALFYGNIVTEINAPKLKTIGTTTGYDSAFGSDMKVGGIITVSRFMETSNGGAVEGDLVYNRDNRACTINYID